MDVTLRLPASRRDPSQPVVAWHGRWLGGVAWGIALGGTVCLAIDRLRPFGTALIVLASALAVSTFGAWNAEPFYCVVPVRPWRSHQGLSWRVPVGGIALGAFLTLQAGLQFVLHPTYLFGAAGWLWLLAMCVLIASAAWLPSRGTVTSATPGDAHDQQTVSSVTSGGRYQTLPADGRIFQRLPFTRWSPLPTRGHPWTGRRGVELLAAVGLFALALFLRVWNLTSVPFAIHPDEILTGHNAVQSYIRGSNPPVFSTVWDGINLPALWFWFVALSLKLGGTTLFALRLPAALIGAVAVLPFYGMVRVAWGRVAAVAGTAILATSASNIQYSRVTLNNITTSFFWALCFYFLLHGLRHRRSLDWTLAGMAGGISEYGYYGTHLLSFVLVTFIAYLLIVHWGACHGMLGNMGLLALGFVTGMGPLLAYYMRHPTIYLGRGAGALTWNHVPRDWTDARLMATTLWPLIRENLLGMSTHADQGTLYWAPLLLPPEAALLALGFALLLWQWRHPAAFLMLLSGVGTLFVGGTLVHGVPFIPHWTPAFPALYAAIAVPIGAWWATFAGSSARLRVIAGTALLVVVVVLCWRNVAFYFYQYQVTRPEFEIRAAQSRWEAALGSDYRVRTVGRTWQPYDPETNSYLIAQQDGAPMPNPAISLPLSGEPGKGIAFVFFPDTDAYQQSVRTLYPGGRTGEVRSHGGIHLFSTYVVSPAQASADNGMRVQLDGTGGSAYHRTDHVDQLGDLPADSPFPVDARWSGNVYVPVAAYYRLEPSLDSGAFFLDAQSIPPAGVRVPAGWHRIVVSTRLSSGVSPRLVLREGGTPDRVVSRNQLWPADPRQGLLAQILMPGQPPEVRVDPFIGFGALDSQARAGVPVGSTRTRWTGMLRAEQAGAYVVMLRTDGSSTVMVDGMLAITTCAHDRIQETTASLRLSAGWHPLQVDHANQPGRSTLELMWTVPGGQREILPADALRYAADDVVRPPPLPVALPRVNCP